AMERIQVVRILRIAASAVCLVSCVLIVTLWVRSYYSEDRASGHLSNSYGVRFYSSRGWLVCSRNSAAGAGQKYPWRIELARDYWLDPADDRLRFSLPVDFLRGSDFASVSIPHWCATLASGVFGVVTFAGSQCRFSLRSLFIAMTMVAVGLGMLVAFAR
ncbi:MAG: hypothetical protein L0219_18290, partial [Phycisphaerales bacterium]|nr:hypothetical protein [Phycisphaerales bacterium]